MAAERVKTEKPEKKNSRKRLNKALKVIKNKYFIVSFIFVVIILFIDKNNLLRWGEDYINILRQERIIRQYKQEIDLLDEKLKELSSNKDSLEKFAREQYFFHEKGEDIFIVE